MAFAIAAIGLAVVFQAFSIGLNTADRVDERMNALRFAQSKLASLGHDIAIRDGLTVGDPEAGFSWVVEVTSQTVDIEGPAPSRLPELAHVVVRVSTAEGDGPPLVELRTVRPVDGS